MKQKDIALILVVIIVSGLASFFISTKLISSESDRAVEVKTVEAISTEFTRPAKEYFNEQSVNPTQTIILGTNPEQPAQSTEQR